MKKILLPLMAVCFMLLAMALPVTAQAASCTCGKSTKPHHDGHRSEMTAIDDEYHSKVCADCVVNGHDATCEQVQLGTEAHKYEVRGNGEDRYKECFYCNHIVKMPCEHEETLFRRNKETDKCEEVCSDCQTVINTYEHKWIYEYDQQNDDIHYMTCERCKDCRDKKHTWKTTYKAIKVPKNPISGKLLNHGECHVAKKTCKDCGMVWEFSAADKKSKHDFKDNKCKLCKYKRIILKQGTVKLKQKGKVKTVTYDVEGHWAKKANGDWYWVKPYSYKEYVYNVVASWKKVKNVYGYVCTEEKVKTGTYVRSLSEKKFDPSLPFTKKTSETISFSAKKKISSKTIYVYPVSKTGHVGKGKSVKIKLK